jgi:hypothetical protein
MKKNNGDIGAMHLKLVWLILKKREECRNRRVKNEFSEIL